MDTGHHVGSGARHGDSVQICLAVVCLFLKVRTFKVSLGKFEMHKQCCYPASRCCMSHGRSLPKILCECRFT